jgi:Polyketide cyclase / dehydrase and lipid transport
MAHIGGEILIGRPIEEVFDFVADERNEPRYNPRMLHAETISPGPIGAGTRFRAKMSVRRRPVEMTTEFTVYERPRRLALTTHLSAMEIHGSLTFDPVPEGTRMRWQWDLEPRGPLRLLRPLIVRMGQCQEQAIWSELKKVLETSEDVNRAGG